MNETWTCSALLNSLRIGGGGATSDPALRLNDAALLQTLGWDGIQAVSEWTMPEEEKGDPEIWIANLWGSVLP